MVWPLDDVTTLAELAADVATGGPFEFVLFAFGFVIMTFSIGALTYLALGAVVDALTPESLGRAPPREA